MRQPARETEIGCGDTWTRAPQPRARAGGRARRRAFPIPALVLALAPAQAGAAPAPGAPPAPFERRDIAEFTAPYQLAVADVNGDKRLDVIALSTSAGRVDWFENPTWQRRSITRTWKNVDLAPLDIDGDNRLDLALANGFAFDEPAGGNLIQWLSPAPAPRRPWTLHSVAMDPVVHRLRWGDLDGDTRPELVHAPIVGPGSLGVRNPKPAHLWAFRIPQQPASGPWEHRVIDESLTLLHGIHVGPLDRPDRRAEILTASAEGIHRFHLDRSTDGQARWHKTQIGPGAPGASEVVPVKLGAGRMCIATIEPWHGAQAVVYTPAVQGQPSWQRHVLDSTLDHGHALAAADFDGDGLDEIVVGWRGGGGGLVLFRPLDARGERFARVEIARDVAAECAVAADLDGDGAPDLSVAAGRNNKIIWYRNVRATPAQVPRRDAPSRSESAMHLR